jgi:hypothetical protein
MLTIAKLHTLRRLLLGMLAIIEAELRERSALQGETIHIRDYQRH